MCPQMQLLGWMCSPVCQVALPSVAASPLCSGWLSPLVCPQMRLPGWTCSPGCQVAFASVAASPACSGWLPPLHCTALHCTGLPPDVIAWMDLFLLLLGGSCFSCCLHCLLWMSSSTGLTTDAIAWLDLFPLHSASGFG